MGVGPLEREAGRARRLAIVPGDGIGPEVVAEGLKVVDAAGVKYDGVTYDLGARRWHRTGETLPDAVLEEIRGHDAILLGAVGDPSVPSGVLERELLLRLRFELDHYVNLRPVKLYPGVETPIKSDKVDMVVVREGTEGLYAGTGGILRRGTPHEIATQESLNSAFGVERVVRYAFEKTTGSARKRLSLVHKTNVLTYAGDLWVRTVERVNKEYPQVETDYYHVDAATMFFVNQPERFDVIVTDNLFGDIITDLGAAVAGGIGLAASGNINPERTTPSMFEPVHGSAPDIAGQGRADPTATILSVGMMLDHLGETEAARRIERAVEADLAERGTGHNNRSTQRIGDAIAVRVGT